MIADNDKKSLLPPHSTPLEHALAATTSRIDTIPVPVRNLWNPDLLHVDFLPFLAWALSVDAWDSNWSEARKRDVIKAAIAVHRVKGTPAALKAALNALGLGVQVKEWFEYGGKPYHFRLDVELSDTGLSRKEVETIEAVALAVKNERSKLEVLKFWLSSRGRIRLAAHGSMREDGLVYPRQETELSQSGHLRTGAATSMLEIATLNRHRTPAANGDGEPTDKTAPPQPIVLNKASALSPAPGDSADNPFILTPDMVDYGWIWINPPAIMMDRASYAKRAGYFYYEVPRGVEVPTLAIGSRFHFGEVVVITNYGRIIGGDYGIANGFNDGSADIIVHNHGTIHGNEVALHAQNSSARIDYYPHPGAILTSDYHKTYGEVIIHPPRQADAPPIP